MGSSSLSFGIWCSRYRYRDCCPVRLVYRVDSAACLHLRRCQTRTRAFGVEAEPMAVRTGRDGPLHRSHVRRHIPVPPPRQSGYPVAKTGARLQKLLLAAGSMGSRRGSTAQAIAPGSGDARQGLAHRPRTGRSPWARRSNRYRSPAPAPHTIGVGLPELGGVIWRTAEHALLVRYKFCPPTEI